MTARGFAAFPPARRRPGHFARSWWGRAWIKAMEDTALDDAQLKQGRKYAYTGYVGAISVSPGMIAATVRDYEDDTAYRTILRLEPLSDPEWARFFDQVSVKAGHIAALLDRDMPIELVDAASDAGVRLLPDIGDLDPDCGCPGWEHPCRHAAALAYQVSWLLDADPFVLLLVRGKDERELLDELRGFSSTPDSSVSAASVFARSVEPLPAVPPPVEDEPVTLAVPAAEGVDPEAVALLAIDAAARARLLLIEDVPALELWPDTVRYAATYPAVAARLHSPGLPRAVAAWRNGGVPALEVLENAWSPGAQEVARVRDTLGSDVDASVWRNRWTVGEVQLRYGKDGQWYPYRDAAGQWWPSGPPQRDAASALMAQM